MSKIDQKYMIVVAIHEGRNFNVCGDNGDNNHMVFLEARFNGEVLVSDSVPLCSPSPEFNTELAWELDRKSLHLFRIERAPIKLQCFVENRVAKTKQLVGYTVLDIRTAQDQKEPKFAWKSLLNSKFHGHSKERPEVSLALQLLKDFDDTNGEALDSLTFLSHNGLPLTVQENNFVNDLRVKISNGFHKIWDSTSHNEKDCVSFYDLCVVITSVSNLVNLSKNVVSDTFAFSFGLFGSNLRTLTFNNLIEGPSCNEEITYKIAVPDLKTLAVYFHLNPLLDIQLVKSSKESLGSVTVSLKDLIKENEMVAPVIGDFKIIPTDDAQLPEENLPSVELFIEMRQTQQEQTNVATTSDKAICTRFIVTIQILIVLKSLC